MHKLMNSFKTKSLRVGGYSVVASLIMIVTLVFINVIVNALPAKYTTLDLSSNQLYTLCEESEMVAKSAKTEVTIYWICQSGAQDTTIGQLLDRYTGLNSKIKVKEIDPDEYPTFATQYEITTIANNSLVVENGERYRYVAYTDIYVTTYVADSSSYYGYSTETSFDGENAITSALNYVLNSKLPVIYKLVGHDEGTLSTDYTSALKHQNIEIKELSLLTTEHVPEDCDVLLIYAPGGDISEDEKNEIADYLSDGGKMMLVTDPAENERPNIQSLAEAYGVTENEGIVIEGDSNYYISRYPAYYLLPNIESHTITSPISSGSHYVFLPIASGLTVSESLPEGVTVSSLLSTSKKAFSKIAGYNLKTYEKEDGDIDGPFSLAVCIEKGDTQIVWITSSSIADDTANQMVSGTNEDFFVNAVSYMTGQTDNISIRSKDLTYSYLTVASGSATLWAAIMIVLLPLALIIIGIVIVVRRKKR